MGPVRHPVASGRPRPSRFLPTSLHQPCARFFGFVRASRSIIVKNVVPMAVDSHATASLSMSSDPVTDPDKPRGRTTSGVPISRKIRRCVGRLRKIQCDFALSTESWSIELRLARRSDIRQALMKTVQQKTRDTRRARGGSIDLSRNSPFVNAVRGQRGDSPAHARYGRAGIVLTSKVQRQVEWFRAEVDIKIALRCGVQMQTRCSEEEACEAIRATRD